MSTPLWCLGPPEPSRTFAIGGDAQVCPGPRPSRRPSQVPLEGVQSRLDLEELPQFRAPQDAAPSAVESLDGDGGVRLLNPALEDIISELLELLL